MDNSKRKPAFTACGDAVLDSISDGVFTVDLNWLVCSFNRAAEQITGISREDAVGSFCWDVFRSNMCEAQCALRETLETGKPLINRTGYIVDAEGNRIPVSVSTAVLRDENGKIIGGAETFRDLSEIETLRSELKGKCSLGGFISHSSSMCSVMELARAVAGSPSTVLIAGETGSGKEVLAKAIHEMGPRSKSPFVAVNCGALPDSLLESELFGYKKGAFTGADTDKPGRFAAAGQGTIFLDEIGEVSPAMQVRLLRVLQERCYEPLGSNQTEKTRARVIAATNQDLSKLVERGSFRQDLYYRINVITLSLPPLRDRKEDIPLLADHFVEKYNCLYGREVPGITPEVYSAFLNYSWPGNVRELENTIERAFVLCGTKRISLSHLPEGIFGKTEERAEGRSIRMQTDQSEKNAIISAIKRNNGNKTAAAKELGIHKTTLYRKLSRLGIE
ncbi:Transcriptional regulatory protein ZraR [Sedimentisphaera cyanobacteriorum]|uniref:Transcriptional regulatory protein ZraR n=1 Tax=Sedimentisphaera cyanobacteriorum TaxID=1940790 RepID=A0A1Q2HRI8_9BACT|nr:sigma 54-interacting transcriptional regulator [Sedimentisphaera cyanobacteriorum]AQQ10010.1 Transcriptional regulatory protein ZraR [Sedimentisphaera cyanobacteriorum]